MSTLTQKIEAFLNEEERVSLHDQDRWFTNRELKGEIGRICQLLATCGVRPGDRVVLGYPNSYAFAAVYLAILKYGATVVPINPSLTATELRGVMMRSQAVAGFFTAELWDMLQCMVEELAEEQVRLSVGFVGITNKSPSHVAVYRLDATEVVDPLAATEPAETDVAVILYTSGTTGTPKAVGLQHRQLLATIENVIESHALTADDVTYCFLPLFHINAQVVAFLSTCLSGGRILFAPKFSASRFWPTVIEHRVTWVSAVPTVIGILLQAPAPQQVPAHLRFMRSASAPLPVADEQRFANRFGIPILQSYGMSEAASQICVNPLGPDEQKAGSVGLPVGVELRVVDESGTELPHGDVGEIVIRGKSIIDSYLDRAVGTDFADGWFHTGDVGYRDEDGYVFLTGRKKELINRAGEKISPYEVEDVIREHPLVNQVAVVGLPDPLYGEKVAAFILTDKGDRQQIKQEVIERCLAAISSYKCPSEISFVSHLPTGPTGKIQRNVLKQRVLARGAVAHA